MQLAFVQSATAAKFIGIERDLNQIITGFSTDSRSIKPGDLFIAVVGARVNGHHYIEEALAKGAVAILVNERVETTLPQLVVKDTIIALGKLAYAHRMQFTIPIIALTGSSGKTTVKEMIASILSVSGPVLATAGNLNTDIGVPLTLLRLNETHKNAVIEMGARHKGDIAYLMQITSPHVSLITNAGVAHKEIFGGEEGIAKAKGEIFEQLNPEGIAIINHDDKNASYWKSILQKQQIVSFGMQQEADIHCLDVKLTPFAVNFTLITDIGSIPIQLSVPGIHTIQNALAAAAVARAMNIDLLDIAQGLKQFISISGRLQFKMSQTGCHLIDDTYNANPASMIAALNVLAQCPGQKIMVMGDMFELGTDASQLHYAMGQKAKELKIDKLLAVGELSKEAVSAFGEGATHYTNKSSLIADLMPQATKTSTILIKGSRGMRMEDIVLALTGSRETHPC